MRLGTILKLDKYLGTILMAVFKPPAILLGAVTRRDHSLEFRKNVTILKPLGGGSLAIAFPALLGLRKKYPDLRIRLVTTRRTAPFARTLDVFDEILEVDDSGIFRLAFDSLRSFYRILGTDTVINLEVYSNLSMVFTLFTCSRNRIGYYLTTAFRRRGMVTQLFYFNRYAGTFEMYDKILQPFGVTPASREECRDHLVKGLPDIGQADGYRISIGHGCSDLGKERKLSAQQWQQVLMSRIDTSRETEVVFLGADRDSALAAEIIDGVSAKMPEVKFLDFCGKKTLAESLSILRSSDEFWGIDSSLIHYARLFDLKTVSYWGPTQPETRLREFPGIVEEVIYDKIPCSPCVHIIETLPCGGDNVCIRRLFEEEKPEWIGMVK